MLKFGDYFDSFISHSAIERRESVFDLLVADSPTSSSNSYFVFSVDNCIVSSLVVGRIMHNHTLSKGKMRYTSIYNTTYHWNDGWAGIVYCKRKILFFVFLLKKQSLIEIGKRKKKLKLLLNIFGKLSLKAWYLQKE